MLTDDDCSVRVFSLVERLVTHVNRRSRFRVDQRREKRRVLSVLICFTMKRVLTGRDEKLERLQSTFRQYQIDPRWPINVTLFPEKMPQAESARSFDDDCCK
jgi:hypothetical protein